MSFATFGHGGDRDPDPWRPNISLHEIRSAIDNCEFNVLYQPKVNTSSLQFVASEALIRWNHPVHGLLRPSQFIGLAEHGGLITELTDYMIEIAFAQWSCWHADGLDLGLSVNVSAATLDDRDLPDRIGQCANKHAADPEKIVLEVTESWLSRDPDASRDILTRLRTKGFSLSIDDFGTGYSSMRQLKEFPYSEIKLDKSFLRNSVTDPEARDIVGLFVDLGHKLGMRVIAEGIETQGDWDLISELGVDEGQGFFIARPMSGLRIPIWLEHWNTTLGANKNHTST